jgi:hypothetical protein
VREREDLCDVGESAREMRARDREIERERERYARARGRCIFVCALMRERKREMRE